MNNTIPNEIYILIFLKYIKICPITSLILAYRKNEQYLLKKCLNYITSIYTIDEISHKFDKNIIDIIFKKRYLIKYNFTFSERAFDDACILNNINQIIWWMDVYFSTGLDLKYTHRALNGVRYHKNPTMLILLIEFFKKYNLQIKYTSILLDWLSETNNIKLLNMFKHLWEKYKFDLKYSHYAIDEASSHGYTDVLDWWMEMHKKHNIKLKYTKNAFDKASIHGHIYILDWWKNSGLQIKNSYYLTYTNDERIKIWLNDNKFLFNDNLNKKITFYPYRL